MNRRTKWILITAALVFMLNIVPHIVKAQLEPPGDNGGDPDLPIDGGLSLFVAAGVGYGIKKVKENRKKQDTNID